jgi:hypothetical protein
VRHDRRREAGQTMINVTNGKLIRLRVDDEPFDIRYGKLGDTSAFIDSATSRSTPATGATSHRWPAHGSWAWPDSAGCAITIAFAPRLPPRLSLLSFRMLYRDRLRVDVRSHAARYELLEGDARELLRHGERVTVPPGSPQTCRRIEPVRDQRPTRRERADGSSRRAPVAAVQLGVTFSDNARVKRPMGCRRRCPGG